MSEDNQSLLPSRDERHGMAIAIKNRQRMPSYMALSSMSLLLKGFLQKASKDKNAVEAAKAMVFEDIMPVTFCSTVVSIAAALALNPNLGTNSYRDRISMILEETPESDFLFPSEECSMEIINEAKTQQQILATVLEKQSEELRSWKPIFKALHVSLESLKLAKGDLLRNEAWLEMIKISRLFLQIKQILPFAERWSRDWKEKAAKVITVAHCNENILELETQLESLYLRI
uniref:Uncharacterized protein n=1 Tax=Astopletus virus TaxID=2800905 RepID=A0A894KKX4_9VIRU|nr:MAG: hypothetical protein [Astopletus virus]QRW42573.1 MAG: hypothetical protein [Astopletus virus]